MCGTIETVGTFSKIEEIYHAKKAAIEGTFGPLGVQRIGHFSHWFPWGASLYDRFVLKRGAAGSAEAQALHDKIWDVAVRTSLAHGGMINEHHGVGLKLQPLHARAVRHGLADPRSDQARDRPERHHESRQGRIRGVYGSADQSPRNQSERQRQRQSGDRTHPAPDRGDARLPLLLDVPSRLPGRSRHASRNPHAARLGADDRSQSRGTLKWNDDSTNELCACADCGMCRTHCVTDQSLPDAIAAARASVAAASIAPKAVYSLHEKLQKWGIPISKGTSSKPAKGEVGIFIGDAAAYLGPQVVGSGDQVVGGGRAPARAGRCRGARTVCSQARSGSRHRHGTLRRPCCRTSRQPAAANCSCSRLATATPSNGSICERLNIAWPAGVAIKEVTAVLAEAAAAGRLQVP